MQKATVIARQQVGRIGGIRAGTCATYVGLNIVLATSTVLPWERLGFMTASGLDLGRGWLVLVAALVAGGMAAVSLSRNVAIHGLRTAQFVSATAAFSMFVVETLVISGACSGSDSSLWDFCVQPVMGIGALIAGVTGLGLGAYVLFRRPDDPSE